MKKYVKRILEMIYALLVGCLAGYSIVQLYTTLSPFWVIPMIPCILFIIHNIICLRRIKKKIKQIEKEFKDKYDFDIRNREALEKYLQDTIKGDKNIK